MHAQAILEYIHTYRYAALLILAILEGPIVALIAGFFVKTGVLSLLPTIGMLILGDLPDSLYYAIGRFGGGTKIIKKIPPRVTAWIEKMWSEHPTKAMFITKLAYGLSIPLLITAGIVKMPYKKFIWRAVLVTLFQYGVLMTLGYVLGHAYTSALSYVKEAQIGVAILAVVFVGGYFLVQRAVRHYAISHQE